MCESTTKCPDTGRLVANICLASPAIAARADGFQSYAVIDASGGISQMQVDMGTLRCSKLVLCQWAIPT
jgi:hypothetical protein